MARMQVINGIRLTTFHFSESNQTNWARFEKVWRVREKRSTGAQAIVVNFLMRTAMRGSAKTEVLIDSEGGPLYRRHRDL